MSDEEDAADPNKHSRRSRFKGAVSRTRTKLTKKNKETATTVDDFLAGGRESISTGRPSVSDSFSASVADSPPPLKLSHQDGDQGLNPADSIPPPQPSPRRIVVPKIDVSNSQRFPAAQPLDQHGPNHADSLLRPNNQGRTQSTSSLAKTGRARLRGLSVQFTNKTPVVIGEGGDEAETPTIEVGRAKARARSVSPPRSSTSQNFAGRIWNRSPLQHIPRAGTSSPKQAPQPASRMQPPPPPLAPGVRDPGSAPSPGIKRVQTGMLGSAPSPMSESRQAAEKEFEMSMGISPATSNSPATSMVSTADSTPIHAPKPIHPPVAPPNVNEMHPIAHGLKSQHGTKSLRNKFDSGEGDVLRDARRDAPRADSPVSSLGSDEAYLPPPGPPPGRQGHVDSVSPASNASPAQISPNPGYGQPPEQPHSRRLVKKGPPPPPPGKLPGPPPGPPPGHPPGRRPDDEVFAPPPGPPPGRRPQNEGFAPPPGMPPGPPLRPTPSQRNPDDEYMGWVPDGVNQTQAPSFPGIDPSGKLAPLPGVDENQEAKPEKHKRRWFRRGS